MTVKGMDGKIEDLRARPLVLLCRTQDGREQEMTVQKCIETQSTFIHVSGKTMDDLDALLAYELNGE